MTSNVTTSVGTKFIACDFISPLTVGGSVGMGSASMSGPLNVTGEATLRGGANLGVSSGTYSPSLLSRYERISAFSLTVGGCGATPSVSANAVNVGTAVVVTSTNGIIGLSKSGIGPITLTALPAHVRPTGNSVEFVLYGIVGAGAIYTPLSGSIGTDGVISIGKLGGTSLDFADLESVTLCKFTVSYYM